MKRNNILEEKIKNIIINNIDKFLNTKTEYLHNIKILNICRQNRYSSRFGGKCIIEYWDLNKDLKEIIVWLKKVEQPERFFIELSSTYKLLEKCGLHRHITKPYWYNQDLGIVCIGNFNGTGLFEKTLKYSLFFPYTLPERFAYLYYDIGKWLQRYHEALATKETIDMESILTQLYATLEKDSYFNKSEKVCLLKHLKHSQDSLTKDLDFTLVRTHNDFSLRNILIFNFDFGIIDWDTMVHPKMPNFAPVWNEISHFLINLQGVLRLHPLVSKKKIEKFKQSFLKGYFEKSVLAKPNHFNELFYIFTLRYFLGIDSDRTLPQIYRRNFGSRYIKMLKRNLLHGTANIE